MIEGETIQIGGTDYTIPALTLRQVKELKGKLNSLITVNPIAAGPEFIEPFLDVVHAALSRNYPDLPREQLEDMLELRNASKIAQAIIALSGLVPSGERKAGNGLGRDLCSCHRLHGLDVGGYELTIPRLQALQRYWRERPPVHMLVAGYLGYKAPGEAVRAAQSGSGMAELMALGRPE